MECLSQCKIFNAYVGNKWKENTSYMSCGCKIHGAFTIDMEYYRLDMVETYVGGRRYLIAM